MGWEFGAVDAFVIGGTALKAVAFGLLGYQSCIYLVPGG
jgi:hypothetical protein